MLLLSGNAIAYLPREYPGTPIGTTLDPKSVRDFKGLTLKAAANMTDQRIRLGLTPKSVRADYKQLGRDETFYIYEVDEDDAKFTKAFIKYVAKSPLKDFYEVDHKATDVAKKIPIRWKSIKRWTKIIPGQDIDEVTENNEFKEQPRRFARIKACQNPKTDLAQPGPPTHGLLAGARSGLRVFLAGKWGPAGWRAQPELGSPPVFVVPGLIPEAQSSTIDPLRSTS
ncbi:hypothetical protein PpBr36_02470 [Pyricularia pennisetigena]|uniref:hypothetical protein n=1 Tax=Pyricularia pennisetigena TaxID=1578925 RepID=UPI001154AEFD|nr:hypothetical protein PpBr36_02470 [Pyricularia pennisetigena]TLS31383.1 hypothetical protein PpBr36_02470 [Pyricularia pennisetigena]